jgi:DNA-directed RNA polymerase subunit L
MSINKGKTGNIHGVEVKARHRTQEPKVRISTNTADGRNAVLKAAKSVYERHHDVIQALAKR